MGSLSDFTYGITRSWPGKKKIKISLMKKNQTSAILGRWPPVFLWAAVIFVFSSIEQVQVSQFFIWDFVAKKIAHVTEYAIFFALLFRATNGRWLSSFFLTILYACSDEFHQSFVPGRTASPLDLGFDLSGANIASYIIWKLKQLRPGKPKK